MSIFKEFRIFSDLRRGYTAAWIASVTNLKYRNYCKGKNFSEKAVCPKPKNIVQEKVVCPGILRRKRLYVLVDVVRDGILCLKKCFLYSAFQFYVQEFFKMEGVIFWDQYTVEEVVIGVEEVNIFIGTNSAEEHLLQEGGLQCQPSSAKTSCMSVRNESTLATENVELFSTSSVLIENEEVPPAATVLPNNTEP